MNNLDILKELNVLHVDDNIQACENIKKTLEYYFKNVFIAHNGEEALEIYNKKECHLLIVDYDMPIMNGFEFLSGVRKENSLIPAIIVSSYDDKEKLFNAIKLELVDYLVKPYSLDELKNVFNLILQWMEKKSILEIKLNKTVTYSYVTKKLTNDSKEISLTPSEFKILEILLSNENRVIGYEYLIDLIEELSHVKSLTNQVYKLNKKLEISLIKNLKDTGYILTR